jgi:hypothetical protein
MIAMIVAGTLDLSSIRPETVDLDHVNDGIRAAARESMGLSHWARVGHAAFATRVSMKDIATRLSASSMSRFAL